MRENLVWLGVACAVALPFLLFYSYYSSPLAVKVGYDQAFFQLVGMGMLDGLAPYRDFHDMKGPYLFFMEWLGQAVYRGRIGCFVLQLLCMVPTLFFIFKIAQLSMKPSAADAGDSKGSGIVPTIVVGLVSCGLCLFVLAISMSGGNLPEELSLPFIMAALYCNLRYFVGLDSGEGTVYKPSWAFVNGFCVAVLAYIRVTNAAVVLAFLLVVAVSMIRREGIRAFGRAFLWLVAGALFATLPVLAYCIAYGVLDEMVRQVFLLGFLYSSDGAEGSRMELFFSETDGELPKLMLMVMAPVATAILLQTRKAWALSVAVLGSVATFVGVYLGHGYLHYAGVVIPLIALSVFFIVYGWQSVERWKLFRVIMACVVVVGLTAVQAPHFAKTTLYSAKQISYHLKGHEQDKDYGTITEVAEMIPDDQRDSVFCFGRTYWSRWYCATGIYPAFRYFDYQRAHFSFDPTLDEEAQKDFESRPPHWLVTSTDISGISEFIEGFIPDNYHLVLENDKYRLFELNE